MFTELDLQFESPEAKVWWALSTKKKKKRFNNKKIRKKVF